MPGLAVDPKSLPFLPDANAKVTITLPTCVLTLQVDPRVNPLEYILFQIFQTLGGCEAQIAALQTVIANLPGCGRPVDDGLPSLVATTDAVRDALVALHDAVDARARAAAGGETPRE